MPDAIPPMGDNKAPLTELLAEECAELKKRADALVAASEKAAITDDDTAGKVTLLGKQIAEWIKKTDAARVERKEPFLTAGKTVDAHFGAILDPLKRAKDKCAALATAWGAKLRKDAEAAQVKATEQARLDKIAADQAAALAALSDDPADAVEAEQQQAAAASKAVEAAAPVHVSVKTDGASASFPMTRSAKIVDLPKAMAWLAEHYPDSSTEWAQKQLNYLARAKDKFKFPEGSGIENVETPGTRFGS